MKKLLLAGLLLFSGTHLLAYDTNTTKCVTQTQLDSWHNTLDNARQKQTTLSTIPSIVNPIIFASSGLISTFVSEKKVWFIQTLFPIAMQAVNLWTMPIVRAVTLEQNQNTIKTIESELNALPLCSHLTNTTRYALDPLDVTTLTNKLAAYQDALEQGKTTNTLTSGITTPLLFLASLPLFYIAFNINKLTQRNLQLQDIGNDFQLQQEPQGQQQSRLNVNLSRRYGILSLILALTITGINNAQDVATLLKNSAFGSALDVAAKQTV